MTLVHTYKLFQNWFGTKEMRSVWAEENMVAKWIKVESALAQAQAEDGVIPSEAADQIKAIGRLASDQVKDIAKITRTTRHVIAGFVRYMREYLGQAGDYFHLGATTQDILETGLTLQIKQSLEIVEMDLLLLRDRLIELAEKYQSTLMSGRSQGQQGLPITFGFKTAIWAWELNDHLKRLQELKKRVLLVSMSGAMGTQASFTLLSGQECALQLPARVGKTLELHVPAIDPHHRTDRFAELCSWLALIGSSLGEIGLEIRDLQRSEVDEVKEAWQQGADGSSTMVHKQNPEPCHWLEGLAKIARGNATAVMDIQMQHERDATRTAALLSSIPESFLCTSRALSIANNIFANLQIKEDMMLKNLKLLGGATMSEAVWLKLFQKTGRRGWSQELIKDLSQKAVKEGADFKDVVTHAPEINAHLSKADINKALDPLNYIGTAREQIQRIIRQMKSST
jgi:adenylosuccinate lyase